MDKEKLFHEIFDGVFEQDLLSEITTIAQVYEFKENDIIIDFGQTIKHMPLLLNGAIKIMREDFDMGELLLYYLESGDTCAMTIECCLRSRKSEIRAIAENDVVMALIPVDKMELWLGKYATWRTFIFSSYNRKFFEMLNIIDQIAFMHMDERIYNYLREIARVTRSKIINKTHQEIAYELNSSRVVISRLLKVLEKQGEIKLNRNSIELLK